MKISNRLLSACLLAAMTSMAQAQENDSRQLPKLSPLTRVLLKEIDQHKVNLDGKPENYVYRELHGKPYLGGLVKVTDPGRLGDKFADMGVLVGTKAGDIWTVQVPLEKVRQFTETPGMSYVQLDEPLRPAMDQARKTTHVDSVHQGINLPWPMTGNDIVVGVMDFGFDYGHPAFFDASGSNYRVKKVWEMDATGTPPAGYTYGHELTNTADILARGTDNVIQTHGTAVAGIAAGSGYGTTNNKLKGVAPDADLVFVGVRRDSIGGQWRQSSFSDFVDGVSYIFSYANAVKLPAVTNISWGSQSGPHDGTSLFNQACDNLSGQGKIIIMSAGNDGQENIHLSKTFTTTDTLINSFVTFSSDTLQRTWVDIWGDTSKTFCANVTLYKNGVAGNSTGYICIDNNLHSLYVIANNGLDTCFVDFITSSSEFNNKPRMTLDIYNKSADSIHVSIKGNDGSIDAWNEYYYFGYKYGYSSIFESLGVPGNVDGNTISTVSDMGSAKSVLLVGAYASKIGWTDINSQTWSYQGYVNTGNIVPFSSRGPMADGRISPDITAPGLTLATATSSFDTRYTPTGLNKQQVVSGVNFGSKTYYYAEFTGTSASSPMAAGIVALMLEANPKLTPQQVHDMTAQTAIKDNFTGALPAAGSNTWGKGKINAYRAVKAANQANSVYEVKGKKPDCALFPNPNNGMFWLQYTAARAEKVQVVVCDIAGRKLYSEDWQVNVGDNAHQIAISLAKGVYMVQIMNAEGSISIKTQVH
ncbi:S8 family serine peptidase [Polluticoccus soli]|uniref:S8 family serine peptidase n=1 Tax=Polluticoccus soli TaxID=3034150 RepID=UPI0023E160B2|nr:S8 family serine peptidase [Flavipsychrobacter sp. JY13-12]